MEVLLGISSNQIWDFTASYVWLQVYTSRTAQGGGGGFKNRKPTGEVSCCETWMAERTDGPKGGWGSESLHLSLSISLCFLLSVSIYLCQSIYLPMYLSICLSVYLPTCLPVYLSIYLSSYLSVYVSICLSDWTIYLSTYLSICLSIYLCIYLSVLSVYLSMYLSFFLSERKKNAGLSSQVEGDGSKLKQFCKASSKNDSAQLQNEEILRDSSIFDVDNTKNEAFLRDLLQNRKVECRADGLVPMRFAIFPSYHHSKVLRLPRKSEARSYEVLHLSQYMHPDTSSSNVPRLPSFLKLLQTQSNPHIWLTFEKVQNPYAPARPNRIRTSKSAPSKSAPELRCILDFDFDMCFAPKWHLLFERLGSTAKSAPHLRCFVHFDLRRGLFRHLNFQKCSETQVVWAFLTSCATAACNF